MDHSSGFVNSVREEFAEKFGRELTLPSTMILEALEFQADRGTSNEVLFRALLQLEDEQGISEE